MRAESAAAKARASEAEADAEAEARERARLEADMGEAANMVPSNTRPCVKLLSISAVSCHASRAPRLDRISGSCARDRRCICRIVTRPSTGGCASGAGQGACAGQGVSRSFR